MKNFSGQKKRKINIKRILFTLVVFLCFLLLFITVVVFIGIRASQDLEVNVYTVEADIVNPLRIVHITDLHNTELGTNNIDLINTIKEQQPDLIFTTGDMINRDDPNLNIICTLIEQLTEISPVYYGYGNHETAWEKSFSQSMADQLTAAGAIVVQDSYIDLNLNGNEFRIGGCMNYYRKWGMMTSSQEEWDMEDSFADDFENTDRYKILLNHIPTSFVDWGGVDEYPVDLVFSGHYHGGMIRIPIINRGVYAPYIGLFPKYTKGIVYGTEAICVQSAGLGTEHSIPRIYNPPEVVVVDLTPATN
ncbi:MAG: metallophosphoesterase [Clostridia bacterium]|nr:metallophosphoesterase [Clostridia bacterium]